MKFKKFILPLLCAAACAVSLAACTTSDNRSQGGQGSQNTQSSQTATAPYVDKEQPDTWFEWKKNNLPTLAQCKQIQPGMSLNDVILKIGRPQRDIGYGAWVLQFDVKDGGALTITFTIGGDGETLYDRLHAVWLGFDRPIPTATFSDLYPWAAELGKDDILKVRREHTFIGVAPAALKDIDYSSDERDIENAYALLSSELTPVSGKEEYTGGGYVQYDFYTAHGVYSVKITNGFVQADGKYYRFKGGCAFENADQTLHAFTTEGNPVFESYTIYGSDGEKIGEYTGLGKFEFFAGGGISGAPAYRLESAAINLLIYSADTFAVEGENEIYKIAGEENFGFLFE